MYGHFQQWKNKRTKFFDPEGFEYNEVLGKLSNGGIPWRDCDQVLVPVNINNAHWVAVALDFSEQKMYVYNSMKSPNISQQLRPLGVMLPKLLKQLAFYDNKPPKKKLRANESWGLEIKHTAKQDGYVIGGYFS